jgi:hypothetical protein
MSEALRIVSEFEADVWFWDKASNEKRQPLKESLELIEARLDEEARQAEIHLKEFLETDLAKHPRLGEVAASRFTDRIEECIDAMPQVTRRAFFLTAFSQLEEDLNELCKLVKAHRHLRLGFQDISGKGVSRALKYLRDAALVPFDKLQKHHENVSALNEIRNAFVHAGGIVKAAKIKSVQKYLAENRGVATLAEETRWLRLNEPFVPRVLEQVESFLEALREEVVRAEGEV